MSSEADTLNKWIADNWDKCDDIERMVDLIEAASAKVQANDVDQVEAVFAGQAAALDVIFGQFARAAGRGLHVFDSMRIALRAQSQSRATYKSLIELKTPRPSYAKASAGEVLADGRRSFSEGGPAGAKPSAGSEIPAPAAESQNFCGQTIENGKAHA